MATDVFVQGVPAASGAPREKHVVAAIIPVVGGDFAPASVFATCREGLESSLLDRFATGAPDVFREGGAWAVAADADGNPDAGRCPAPLPRHRSR